MENCTEITKENFELIYGFYQDKYTYHKRYFIWWSDLIPIIKKIDTCYSSLPFLTEEYYDEYQKVEDALTNNYDIEETIEAVIKFIKWYNENKT